jgi:hypothetical protein
MKAKIAALAAVVALVVGTAAGCSTGSDQQSTGEGAARSASEATADLIKVECYWKMRSGDEPVEWERELPEGDTAAYEQAEKDCTATRSGAKIRVVS